MNQQITFLLSTPWLTNLCSKSQNAARFYLVAAATFWVAVATAATTPVHRAVHAAPLPGDTSITETICANETYSFDGETLDQPGQYSAVFEASDGSDSTVTLELVVLPVQASATSATICSGEPYDFYGRVLEESGIYTAVLEAENGCDSTVTLTLDVLPTPSTHFNVGICTGSEYVFEGNTLTDSGIYIEQYTAENGCDSTVVLNLVVADFFEVSINATICAGETYTFGDETLDQAGTYVHALQAAGGCDSTITLTLVVLPTQTGATAASICQGDTLFYQGAELTEPGTYDFVLTAENGCDSTVTLTLTVLPVADSALSVSICAGETYDFNGTTLDESGLYTAVLDAENGCDSTVTLTLTVLPVADSTLSVSICAGETYDFNGTSLDESGVFTAVLDAENGCDSTVTLLLEVLPVQVTHEDAIVCENTPFSFNGELLTQPGDYTAVFTGLNGCDSTVTLTLAVLPLQHTTVIDTTCANETYTFDGDTLTASGSYLFTYDGANGCDSTVTLQLVVLPVPETTIEAAVCAGETYEYAGAELTQSGSFPFIFTAENGCDSIVHIDLTVLPLAASVFSVTLCEGASYDFNGEILDENGVYTATFTGANGCDSTVTLQLTFVPTFETALEASICDGDVYEFGGTDLTAPGSYTLNLVSSGGCDSIVTLTLNLLLPVESTTDATICEGTSYEFNGQSYSAGGDYPIVLTGSNGCDSTAVLRLVVLPVVSTNLSATICSSESYAFDGDTLLISGVYTAVLNGANGCDSTVVLNLTVLPEQGSTLEVSICPGESYEYNGQTLTAEAAYEFTLDGSNGCDSIVILQLTVLPNAESAFAALVCDGASFTYHNQVLTVSGIYEFTFTGASSNGCDSLVTLYLTIFPAIPPTQTAVTICEGTSYDFYGMELTAPGNYQAQLPSATGCDSTILLTLTVSPNIALAEEATICGGEVYPFYGQGLDVSGVYTAVLPATAGCDTVVTLTLTVTDLNTSVTLTDGTLTAAATNALYQWIECSDSTIIFGATGSSFTPEVTGDYAVVIIQGFCLAVSDCQLVEVVGTQEPLSDHAWTLQPNPARSSATIMLLEPGFRTGMVEIYDPAGRLLRNLHVLSGTPQIDLDLTGLPDGMLFVRLSDERGASTKRLIKTKE